MTKMAAIRGTIFVFAWPVVIVGRDCTVLMTACSSLVDNVVSVPYRWIMKK